MIAKVALVCFFAAVALADRPHHQPAPSYNAPAPSYSPPAPSYNAPAPSYNAPHKGYREEPTYEDTPPKYAYDYAVNDQYSGVNFNQQENRDGYKTEGAYYVALPDGRTQKVTYYVDGDSGYVAEVSYEGEAQYPEQQGYKSASQPSYKPAPQPSYKPAPKPSYKPAPKPSYQPAPKPAYG